MNDIEKRARELFAEQLEADHRTFSARMIRSGQVSLGADYAAALRAIRAALTPPEALIHKESEEEKTSVCGGMAASGADGFVLVPRELTHEMYCAFVEQWFTKVRAIDDAEMDDCYAAMLAARPEVSP